MLALPCLHTAEYRCERVILGGHHDPSCGSQNVCLIRHPLLATVCSRCPYYELSMFGLYGTLNNTVDLETNYWGALFNTSISQCNISLTWLPQEFRANFFANVNNPTCGEYFQLSSLYPGSGPCYPVFVETVEYLNRRAAHTTVWLGPIMYPGCFLHKPHFDL